ncbi:MAG TPA: hypothetical protein VER07_00485 [Candidatus Polarisedimenticolia bacterium]|nr:hypothetical protein [Candidatus Polarisedimenticolia bacterium]
MPKFAPMLLLLVAVCACDAPWDGPGLPAGAITVGYTTLSELGPPAIGEDILASTSLADLRTQVLASRSTFIGAGQPCRSFVNDADLCWMNIGDQPGRLYVAVATFETCYRTVKEAAAVKGQELYFIHWVGKSQRGCNLALAMPHWRLIFVRRDSLPRSGLLTVDLQIQEDGGTQDISTETDLAG